VLVNKARFKNPLSLSSKEATIWLNMIPRQFIKHYCFGNQEISLLITATEGSYGDMIEQLRKLAGTRNIVFKR